MAGELRCKAIRYKTALPLIQGGSATAGPMCAERCPRDYVCEPAVPNFKAHPVVGHKENGESIFRYIYTDIQKELTVKLRQSIEVYQSVELTEESRMALGQWLEQWLKNICHPCVGIWCRCKDSVWNPGTYQVGVRPRHLPTPLRIYKSGRLRS